MKKKLFLLLICVLFLFGCKIKNNSEEGKIITLSYEELKEKIDKEESFILVVTRTDCSHCAIYLPRLQKVLEEYKLTAYKIEIDEWTDEETGSLKDICNVSGTPTTIFIENGEEKNTSSRLVGSKSQEQIIQRFKAMGYIKESE